MRLIRRIRTALRVDGGRAGVISSLRDTLDRGDLTRPPWRLLVVIALLATASGFLQAAVLLFIVQAGAILASSEELSAQLGPFAMDSFSVGQLLWVGVALAVVLLVVEMVVTHLSARVGAEALRATRGKVSGRYTQAQWAKQARMPPGELEQLLTNHTGKVAGLMLVLARGTTATMNFATMLLAAVVISPFAALLVSIGLAVILLVLRPVRLLTRRIAIRATAINNRFAIAVSERAALAKEVEVFGASERYQADIDQLTDETANVQYRLVFLGRATSVWFRLSTMFLVLAILGAINRFQSTDVAATIAAVLVLVRAMSFGQAVQDSVQEVYETLPWVEALYDIVDDLEPSAQMSGERRTPAAGGLHFDDVGFSYDGVTPVLSNVTVDIADRQAIGIIGPSGAGKTTFLDLALGLRHPVGGCVSYGGVALDDIDPDWWHANVAFVPQDSVLFSGSLRENVEFYRDIDDAEVRRAIAAAQLTADLAKWREGAEVDVGHRGSNLSGGQRQRAAIARAIAGVPQLVALDEPTSALDPETEALMSATIAELSQHAIVMVVAHRMSTVHACDQLLVIEDGRVTAFGPPALVRSSNEYCKRAFEIGAL